MSAEAEATPSTATEDVAQLAITAEDLPTPAVEIVADPAEAEPWYTSEAETRLAERLAEAEAESARLRKELEEARAAPDGARYATAVALARAADHFAETGERGRSWNDALVGWRAARRG